MAQREIFIAGKNFVGEKSDSSAARIGAPAAVRLIKNVIS